MALLASVAAMLVGATDARAAAAEDGSNYRVTTVTLTSIEVQSQEIDLAPEGTFSLGDRFVFSDDLYRHGQKVGHDGGECVLVRHDAAQGEAPASFTFNCVVTLSLPGGQLTVQALFTASGEEAQAAGGEPPMQDAIPLAITGGTERYRNARGDATLTELPDGGSRIRLRIIR